VVVPLVPALFAEALDFADDLRPAGAFFAPFAVLGAGAVEAFLLGCPAAVALFAAVCLLAAARLPLDADFASELLLPRGGFDPELASSRFDATVEPSQYGTELQPRSYCQRLPHAHHRVDSEHVPVRSVVVPVRTEKVTVKEASDDVEVMTQFELARRLLTRPAILGDETLAAVFEVAPRSTT
jgi:hypothetical protein